MSDGVNNTDRLANEHEVSKALRTILKDAGAEEAQILATLLSKMRYVAPGKKRRAADRPRDVHKS